MAKDVFMIVECIAFHSMFGVVVVVQMLINGHEEV